MKKIRFSEKILNYAKKIKSIDYLGGKCEICKESNILKLTFHHKNTNEKEFKIADYKSKRWSELKKELDKCQILCNNCHREFHYNESILKYGDSRRKDKNIYLEYSNGKCVECGYNKCPAALTFHHRNPNEKEISIGSLSERINSISELSDRIKNEIDKCDLLCSNCHYIKHSDIKFFEENKEEILLKSKNLKEIQSKINREEVFKMFRNGIKQVDIAKHFKASNGTISDIIRGR